jgi:2',3'-cyclic-nucleotide 2'-phosphodiesterase (5'-nucleotidase family)
MEPEAAPGRGRVVIYHTNDMHDRRAPVKALQGVKKDSGTLFLDAGDALAGSNTVFQVSEPIIDEMNRAGYDAMAMGNREFNYIRRVMGLRAGQARFPILCANIVDLAGRAGQFVPPYVILQAGGLRVGVFGLTPVQYGDDSFWLPLLGFRFLNPFETALDMARKLKDQADVVVLLSHLGLPDDEKLAGAVKGIHLIIGGHSHSLLESPVRAGDSYILQAGAFGTHYGRAVIRAGGDPPLPPPDYELMRAGS